MCEDWWASPNDIAHFASVLLSCPWPALPPPLPSEFCLRGGGLRGVGGWGCGGWGGPPPLRRP